MNSQSKIIEETVDTVETVFEIYLCDNCEAELYSKDAYDVSNLVFYDNPRCSYIDDQVLGISLSNAYQMKYLKKNPYRWVDCDAMLHCDILRIKSVDSMKKSKYSLK